MTALIKAIALPPASLLLLAIAGLWLRRRRPRFGDAVLAFAIAALYILSMPIFSSLALRSLESPYADPRLGPPAQAIVVLAGGSLGTAPEYGTDVAHPRTVARIRYAARLQRLTGVPILVSGGSDGRTSPEAEQMRTILVEEMNVPVRWVENRALDTYTNALESRSILAAEGVTRVYLVTHAWHMRRARLAFEHAGFTVIPAPTQFTRFDWSDIGIRDFLPRASSLMNSYYFCHEVLGYAEYALRIRFGSSTGGAKER